MKNRQHLQDFQKKLLDFMEIVGGIFLAIMVFFRVQLDRELPMWYTIACLSVAISFAIVNLLISKKLREM